MEQLLCVAESASEGRFYERLARAGLPLATISPAMLKASRKDALYLLTAECAAHLQLDAVPGLGVHLCLMPPWPAHGLDMGKSRLLPTPAEHRDPIQLDAQLAMHLPGPVSQERLLSILYREQFTEVAGTTLGASLKNEVVLLALPRASNLHGLRLITTLLLGQPSTQTDLDDSVALLQALSAWVAAQPGTPAAVQKPTPPLEAPSSETERQAQLTLLALALLLPENTGNDRRSTGVPIVPAQVHHLVELLSQLLDISASPAGFAQGWEALGALGIVSPALTADQAEAISLANIPRAREYLDAWQLGPRLRRLRAAYGATLQQMRDTPAERPVDQAQAREG